MKKILFLLLLTASSYGQTLQNPTFGTVTTKTSPTVTDDPYVTTTGATGVQGKIAPVNLLIPHTPVNYSVPTQTIGNHLAGIDTRLGQISSTTAGITQRVYFTADNTTVTAGTFFTSSLTGKGSTATGSPPALVLADNTKAYFTKDIISIAQPSPTIGYAGTYSGNLTVSATPTPVATQQRFTVEVYRTDNLGTPIASGVSGATTGDLGVTVLAILDSGIVNLSAGSITNVPVSGVLTQNITLNTGERLRYHVSAAKIGTGGGNVTFGVYYGNAYNSYYDVPVAITTDAVLNKSGVTGVTSTDALNLLNSKIPTTYTKVVYVNSTSPNSATIFDTENPPITNNDLLKNDVANLYIGTDASNWVYNSGTATYVTKTISSTTSNFYLQGTPTDAGNSKTANISRTGSLEAKSFIKTGATADQALVGDGSIRTLSDVQNGVVQSLQTYRINLSNFNNEKSLDLNTRRNLIVNSETYTTANNFFTANSATIDNNDIMYFQGIKMVKLKDANFFSNLNIRQTNLVTGKRYMFSYYVKSNVGEDFIFDDIGDSNQSGHRRRFIDSSVRRVCWIGQAISNTFLDKFLVPTTSMGSGTGSYATIGVSKTFTASDANPYGNMYIGGVQIEEIPDTYVDGVVWMGDSTIAGDAGLNNGYQNTAIPSLFSDIMNCSSFNKGVAGERLDQIDARWATSVTPLKNNSKYVIIQGGLNDIGQGTRTLADMQASINSMNAKALADGLIPIYLTCSPNDNFDATQETLRDNFNYWLLTTFVKVIDINNAIEFNSKLTQGFPRYVTDGIHYGLTLRKAVAGFIAKSPFFEFLKPTEYQATTATYTGKDLIAKNISAEQITTTAVPTTSAGGYDVLTRNTATGVTEKVASGNFAIDANALHKTTNETFTGAKSAVNTGTFGVVNGLNLENSGTSDSRVINILNSNTGIGTYLINSSSGTGSYDTNSSSGVLKIFESSTGSTGDLTRWTKNLVIKAKVDQNGEFTAQKYNLNTGSNSSVGNAVLVAGTINVTTTAATTNSIVILTRKTAGGTIGNLTYTTGSGGITIVSDSASDTSTVSYLIIN